MSTKNKQTEVMKGNLHQITTLFLCICIYRLLNAYIIQTQFDPDEYWQTLEPAYCLAFGSPSSDSTISLHASSEKEIDASNEEDTIGRRRQHGCALTWEWTRRYANDNATMEAKTSSSSYIKQQMEQMIHGPVRSYISILPTYWYYLTCRSIFNWAYHERSNEDELNNNKLSLINYIFQFQNHIKQIIQQNATYIISKGPVYLHAILIAAPTDLCIWLISKRIASTTSAATNTKWPYWALLCSITSWFHGYALIRTYANSFETVCLVVGITLLGEELFNQNDQLLFHNRLQTKLAFVIGGLSACVRFTSLSAWIPIGCIISYRSGLLVINRQRYSYKNMMHTLFGTCALFGMMGVIIGCCIDRFFYGFWAIPFLGNIHFNVILGHGTLYGTHPMMWYIYAGLPAICGIMLPFFLWEVGTVVNAFVPSPRMTLLKIIVPYIILHSFSEHKEFRFLLPMLPLICILAGHAITRLLSVAETSNIGLLRMITPKLILTILVLLNYPHLLYLGIIHQRGPVAVNQYIASTIQKSSDRNGERSIHYLMGCHSTPMYSHLHLPTVRIQAWYLGCSPDCRSKPEIECESNAFSRDPFSFVESTYVAISIDGSCIEVDSVDDSCMDKNNDVKEPPSFLVVMQDDAKHIENVLREKLQMSHLASIRHTIKSVALHDSSANHYDTTITLFSMIDIHFDHIEVFIK